MKTRANSMAKVLNGYMIFFLIISLALISAFRSLKTPDTLNYIEYFIWENPGRSIEYGFMELIKFVKLCLGNNYRAFFLVSALISISLKLFAIYRLSRFIWGSIVIYIATKFILHDMIQMRAAISSGFFLISIYYLVYRDLKIYFSLTILAILFHWTALVMIPLWFLSENKIRKNLYYYLIIGSYVFAFLGGSIAEFIPYIPINAIKSAYIGYISTMELNDYNLFSGLILLKAILAFIFVSQIYKLIQYNKCAIIVVKIYIFSIVSYLVFSTLPVAAARISEFLQVTEIILYPMVIYLFPYKKWILGKFLNLLIGFSLWWFNVYVQKLLI